MRRQFLFGASITLALLFASNTLAGSGQALKIVVSKDQQQLKVYDGATVVAQSNVSTGKRGHSTPSGIFSILEKRKRHYSNLYDNAPMPWMQRITWSGVALHESRHVPSYPASHGCVRMPRAFAKELFKMTERGAHVIISDAPVAPTKLDSAKLFQPRLELKSINDIPLRTFLDMDGTKPVELAYNAPIAPKKQAADKVTDRDPIYILITRKQTRTSLKLIQQELFKLGFDPGPFDGFNGPKTRTAVQNFRKSAGLDPQGGRDQEFWKTLRKQANLPAERNGVLIIRRKFKEIYRADIVIKEPHRALGTHFLEARNVSNETGKADWYGLSLENQIHERTAKRLGITEMADPNTYNAAIRAFQRIELPASTRDKVEELLSEGSALTITDTGHQRETGLGTNFVTITRKAPASKG